MHLRLWPIKQIILMKVPFQLVENKIKNYLKKLMQMEMEKLLKMNGI